MPPFESEKKRKLLHGHDMSNLLPSPLRLENRQADTDNHSPYNGLNDDTR